MDSEQTSSSTEMELAKQRLKEFEDNVNMFVDEVIDFENSDKEILLRKGHAEVTLDLCHQFMIEDVTDILAEKIDMLVLHADHTVNGRDWRVIGFTKPTKDKMYFVFMKSSCYGIIEDLTIDFYYSLETMLARVRELFFSTEEQTQKGMYSILERMTASDIWKTFN